MTRGFNQTMKRIVSDDQLAAQREFYAALDRLGPRFQPACADEPELWYADKPEAKLAAMQACQVCPLATECGAVAKAAPTEIWGIWAGEDRNKNALRTSVCQYCGESFYLKPKAPPHSYCEDPTCRARAHTAQKKTSQRRKARA